MSAKFARVFLVMRYTLALSLLLVILLPFTTRGEEGATEAATTTEPALIPGEQSEVQSTEATSTATSSESNSTSTTTASSTAPIEIATATEETKEEVLGAEISFVGNLVNKVLAAAETVEEFVEEVVEESFQPIITTFKQQLPRLTKREFKKKITLDQGALHGCAVEPFRIDLSGKKDATAEVLLNKDADISFTVEIGSLPKGINIYFRNNEDYQYLPGTSETVLPLYLVNESGSQKGDFTVPIIFTKKNIVDSSVICQINVVNL